MSGHVTQRQRTNEKITEVMLEYAGACHVENIAMEMDAQEQLPDKTPYPPELDVKVRKLIVKHNRRMKRKGFWETSRKAFIKVAVFAFIIILGISTLAVGVEAFRIKLLNFIVEVQTEYTRVEIGDSYVLPDAPHVNIQDWENVYLPTYIPKGFSVSKAEDMGEVKAIRYSNPVGDLVDFSQYNNIDTDLRIDTQSARTETVMLQGEKALLIDKDGLTTIIWHNHEFMFMMQANIDKDELIKMAESIEKNK